MLRNMMTEPIIRLIPPNPIRKSAGISTFRFAKAFSQAAWIFFWSVWILPGSGDESSQVSTFVNSGRFRLIRMIITAMIRIIRINCKPGPIFSLVRTNGSSLINRL